MTWDEVKGLAGETVVTPSSGARRVVAYAAPTGLLWQALAVVAVLHGIYYGLLLPGAARSGLVSPALANAPLIVAACIFAFFALMVLLLAQAGRFLGGAADVPAMLKVTIWLQALRLLAQIAISAVSIISPLIGWLGMLVVGIWGLWVLLSFIATAHGFEIIKAVGALVMAFIVLIFVMSILTAIAGFAPPTPTGDI